MQDPLHVTKISISESQLFFEWYSHPPLLLYISYYQLVISVIKEGFDVGTPFFCN